MTQTNCSGCGAVVADIAGPTHDYISAAPGCWRVFGELQADQMQRFGYPPVHGLVVDAYAAQHPGDGRDRRDRQSVFIHLVALCASLERSMRRAAVTRLVAALADRHTDFPALARSSEPGSLTVMHMVGAEDVEDYCRRAREWATVVWMTWTGQHEVVRAALDRAVQPAPGESRTRPG